MDCFMLLLFTILVTLVCGDSYNGFVTELYSSKDTKCTKPLYLNFHIFDKCIPFDDETEESVLYSHHNETHVSEKVFIGYVCTGGSVIHQDLKVLDCQQGEKDYIVKDWEYKDIYKLYKDFASEGGTTTFQFESSDCTGDVLVGWSGYEPQPCHEGCNNATMTYCGPLK